MRNDVVNSLLPTGSPSNRNPSVSSIGSCCDGMCLLGLVEYLVIALVMSCAKVGLVTEIARMGVMPFVDVSILVFPGLMKQPRGIPCC